MDGYQEILNCLQHAKQSLNELDLTYLQRISVLDSIHEISKVLLHTPSSLHIPKSQNSTLDPSRKVKDVSSIDNTMSITEAAEYLNLAKSTVSRVVKKGLISSHGERKAKRLYESDVLRFAKYRDDKIQHKQNIIQENKMAKQFPEEYDVYSSRSLHKKNNLK